MVVTLYLYQLFRIFIFSFHCHVKKEIKNTKTKWITSSVRNPKKKKKREKKKEKIIVAQ